MDRGEVIRKVKSMLRFTSENSTEAEAANAASMAKKLLHKYQLSLEDLQESDGIIEHPVYVDKRIPLHVQALGQAITDCFDCVSLNGYHPRQMLMVGNKSDVEVAEYFFTCLLRELRLLAYSAAVNSGEPSSQHRTYVNNFIIAASFQIRSRLKKVETTTPDVHALVVSKRQAVEDYVENLGIGHGPAAPELTSAIGLREGMEAGKTIDLPNAVAHQD